MKVAECCKKITAIDDSANEDDRDLAYSTGLCSSLGLMGLVHMEPRRTNSVLRKAAEEPAPGVLTKLFAEELATDHKLVTAELARAWSLPEPMLAAYQCRALTASSCDVRLGQILIASVAAVENANRKAEDRKSLQEFATPLGLQDGELQDVASLSERQEERVLSLASNMSR